MFFCFGGVCGKCVVIIFLDGVDLVLDYIFEEVFVYVCCLGVIIYSIGFLIDSCVFDVCLKFN